MAKLYPRRKLPPAPSGDEMLDIEWASFIHHAPSYLDGLPKDVDPFWATTRGVMTFWLLALDINAAEAELMRTSQATTLCRLRERQLSRLNRQLLGCGKQICSALAAAARAVHPKADEGQIWMLVFDGFKRLMSESRKELAEMVRP